MFDYSEKLDLIAMTAITLKVTFKGNLTTK